MTSTLELETKQLPFQLVKHPGSAHSATEAAETLGLEVGQIVKTLCLIGAVSGPIIILASGNERLHLNQLRQFLADKSLHFATPEQVLDLTGYAVGLVTPFGLKQHLPIFVTPTITSLDTCAISSGQLGAEIILTAADLVRGTTAQPLPDDASLSISPV